MLICLDQLMSIPIFFTDTISKCFLSVYFFTWTWTLFTIEILKLPLKLLLLLNHRFLRIRKSRLFLLLSFVFSGMNVNVQASFSCSCVRRTPNYLRDIHGTTNELPIFPQPVGSWSDNTTALFTGTTDGGELPSGRLVKEESWSNTLCMFFHLHLLLR